MSSYPGSPLCNNISSIIRTQKCNAKSWSRSPQSISYLAGQLIAAEKQPSVRVLSMPVLHCSTLTKLRSQPEHRQNLSIKNLQYIYKSIGNRKNRYIVPYEMHKLVQKKKKKKKDIFAKKHVAIFWKVSHVTSLW
jgi:hypothetical protein